MSGQSQGWQAALQACDLKPREINICAAWKSVLLFSVLFEIPPIDSLSTLRLGCGI